MQRATTNLANSQILLKFGFHYGILTKYLPCLIADVLQKQRSVPVPTLFFQGWERTAPGQQQFGWGESPAYLQRRLITPESRIDKQMFKQNVPTT